MKENIFLDEVMKKILNKNFFISFTVEVIVFISRVFVCIVIYAVITRLLKKLSNKKITQTNIKDKTLNSFVKSAMDISVHIMVLTLCLLILGVKESSLIAFFGTLGIGVGLALKDYLSNFAGGIIILMFKTHKVGDEILISNHVGNVQSIDIFATTIKTADNDIIIIPNGNVVSSKIINHTKTPLRRLKVVVSISYDDNIDLARKVLEELMNSEPKILKKPEVFSHVEDYGDNSIDIAIKGWCNNDDYWNIKQEFLTKIKPKLDEANISMPFPQMDVHMTTKIVRE